MRRSSWVIDRLTMDVDGKRGECGRRRRRRRRRRRTTAVFSLPLPSFIQKAFSVHKGPPKNRASRGESRAHVQLVFIFDPPKSWEPDFLTRGESTLAAAGCIN